MHKRFDIEDGSLICRLARAVLMFVSLVMGRHEGGGGFEEFAQVSNLCMLLQLWFSTTKNLKCEWGIPCGVVGG